MSDTSSVRSSPLNSYPATPLGESDFDLLTPATERSVLFDDISEVLGGNDSDYVLIVGGLGYIGSHTAWELLKAGKNVVIVDNCSNSYISVFEKLEYLHANHLPAGSKKPVLAFHQADYRDKERMCKLLANYNRAEDSEHPAGFRISGVIHFAAFKAVAESFQKPLEYYDNNVSGVIQFCSTLAEFGIKRLVFSSSATVYGELANAGGRLYEQQCDSSGAVGLTNPYGRTKWMCEAILSDLAFSDPDWTIIALRYFNPIGCDETGLLGEDPRGTPNNLMPIVVKTMTGDLPTLSVFGSDRDTPDGTAIRDFIHVSDLASGHVAAMNSMQKIGSGYHIFNLGTGTGYSVTETVDTMRATSGRAIPTVMSARREGDVGICIAEPSKSAAMLDWWTKRSLSQACKDICRYLKIAVV